jgi:hypothetical protein
MRLLPHHPLVVASLVLAFAASSVHAQEVPLVTGEHWMRSSEAVKKAYLIGMANLMLVESAYSGNAAGGDAQTIVPRIVRGLRGGGQTLDSVRTGLDTWYGANPGRLQRPVIETIWFEMVVPGLQKAN